MSPTPNKFFAVSVLTISLLALPLFGQDLEKRVQKLEKQVEALKEELAQQRKSPRKFFCEKAVFTKTFRAYGPTQLEASERLGEQCRKENSEIHCRDPKCRLNE